jgi:hypothetical protein
MANESNKTTSVTDQTLFRSAIVVFVVVWIGYVWTLSPTVTFWDAGEFLAAAKILGVPHPPGTPAFVMLANVWGTWFPFGGFAYRVNFMSAVFSAAAASFMFLVVANALRRHAKSDADAADPVFVVGGAVAAAVMSAFVFTVWQNSNEAEVYMVASFTIAAIAWLASLWRKHRGTSRAAHLLLLIIYLGSFSLGNHLLALLVGPALVGFMWHVLKTDPLPDEADRKIEWAQWAVIGGIWAVLIGSGLGSTAILTFSGLVFVAAAVFAITTGGALFTASVVVIAAVGVSTYTYLYIRAGLNPMINEADPSTWESLLAVIRREQYPPRLPTDNPIYPSGPGNPGRTFTLIWLQIINYLQYFDWQWSNSLSTAESVFAKARLPFTMVFTSLGIYGATVLRHKDRSAFWLILLIFLITGPGLVGYMNFKPGFSLGFDAFPDYSMHEVRERDYFFLISFQVWGLFTGIGLAGLYRLAREKLEAAYRESGAAVPGGLKVAPVVFVIALCPFLLNYSAASRGHGPEAGLALDFARNLLNSVEPYGIIFTNGDNDTFPLWYAQEVEEIRQDVSVVNLSLGNTRWYVKQLRDNAVREFDPEQAPWYAADIPATPPGQLHTLTDDVIDTGMMPQLLRDSLPFNLGRIRHAFPPNSALYMKDWLMLRLIVENAGERPIYWSTTAGSSNWLGLDDYMIQQGMALRLYVAEEPDIDRLAPGLWVPVDVPRTDSLAWEIYDYAGLFEVDSLALDPTNRNIAGNLSLPFLVLGGAYQALGENQRMEENFLRAYHLSPNPAILSLLAAASQEVPGTDVPEAAPLEVFDSLLPVGEQPESLLRGIDTTSN